MEHFTYHIHSSVTLATSAISNFASQESDDEKLQKIFRLLLNSEERENTVKEISIKLQFCF